METPGTPCLTVTTDKPNVKFFGVGNAGIVMLDAANTPEFAGAAFVAVNTDAASLATCGATVKFHLENKLLRGLGSSGDAERGKALAEEQFSNLKDACEGANVVCILAGLGGGAGSGIAPVLARAAREAGALVLAFVTLPFDCEGNHREQQAQQSLEHLKVSADGVICLPSQKVFRIIGEDTGVLETFSVTSGLILEGLRGVWQLLTRPGLIQVHFSDLCHLIRDRHVENAFAFVEATGAGRSREVVEKILAHPLLDEGRALAESGAVLVSLTAGKTLTMAEVNRVMSEMKRQCGQAQIIMGAAIDAALGEKLCVTIIAAKQSHLPKLEETSRTATARGGVSLTATNQAELSPSRPTRPRRAGAKLVQSQLPLSIVSKGRFDKSEPTLHQGEDLDVPTFLRRGVVMN
jgi:cell division protein FtsZ